MTSNETIVFGGGCFWCTEAVFKLLRGVISVRPGYAGGDVAHPAYELVATGQTRFNQAGTLIVTTVEPLQNFTEAEDYHKDFYSKHQGGPYCQVVINPKLEKVKARFAELLREQA